MSTPLGVISKKDVGERTADDDGDYGGDNGMAMTVTMVVTMVWQ